jgi:hypothetical protein
VKSLIKRALGRCVQNELTWRLLDASVLRVARYAHLQRTIAQRTPLFERAIAATSADLVVQHGVFAGMKYPGRASVVSPFFPKLIGSYERELHPILERVCGGDYSEIVDIGCAEGYYAVGFALRLSRARVFAYDTDAHARTLCSRMAQLNGVSDRVTVGSQCTPHTLVSLPLTSKALILSDCEGYEKELFTPGTVAFLRRHDVLIEVHDYVDPTISLRLSEVFEPTHDLLVIHAVDDSKKAQQYRFPELEHFDLPSRRLLLGEYRTGTQEWFYFTPRSECSSALP